MATIRSAEDYQNDIELHDLNSEDKHEDEHGAISNNNNDEELDHSFDQLNTRREQSETNKAAQPVDTGRKILHEKKLEAVVNNTTNKMLNVHRAPKHVKPKVDTGRHKPIKPTPKEPLEEKPGKSREKAYNEADIKKYIDKQRQERERKLKEEKRLQELAQKSIEERLQKLDQYRREQAKKLVDSKKRSASRERGRAPHRDDDLDQLTSSRPRSARLSTEYVHKHFIEPACGKENVDMREWSGSDLVASRSRKQVDENSVQKKRRSRSNSDKPAHGDTTSTDKKKIKRKSTKEKKEKQRARSKSPGLRSRSTTRPSSAPPRVARHRDLEPPVRQRGEKNLQPSIGEFHFTLDGRGSAESWKGRPLPQFELLHAQSAPVHSSDESKNTRMKALKEQSSSLSARISQLVSRKHMELLAARSASHTAEPLPTAWPQVDTTNTGLTMSDRERWIPTRDVDYHEVEKVQKQQQPMEFIPGVPALTTLAERRREIELENVKRKAATLIQKVYRGHKARKEYNSTKKLFYARAQQTRNTNRPSIPNNRRSSSISPSLSPQSQLSVEPRTESTINVVLPTIPLPPKINVTQLPPNGQTIPIVLDNTQQPKVTDSLNIINVVVASRHIKSGKATEQKSDAFQHLAERADAMSSVQNTPLEHQQSIAPQPIINQSNNDEGLLHLADPSVRIRHASDIHGRTTPEPKYRDAASSPVWCFVEPSGRYGIHEQQLHQPANENATNATTDRTNDGISVATIPSQRSPASVHSASMSHKSQSQQSVRSSYSQHSASEATSEKHQPVYDEQSEIAEEYSSSFVGESIRSEHDVPEEIEEDIEAGTRTQHDDTIPEEIYEENEEHKYSEEVPDDESIHEEQNTVEVPAEEEIKESTRVPTFNNSPISIQPEIHVPSPTARAKSPSPALSSSSSSTISETGIDSGVLKILKERERIIEEKANAQLALLALQRQKLSAGHSNNTRITLEAIEEKEKLIQMKLAVQKSEIRRLKLAHKEEAFRKQLLLKKQQQEIQKMRKTTELFKERLKNHIDKQKGSQGDRAKHSIDQTSDTESLISSESILSDVSVSTSLSVPSLGISDVYSTPLTLDLSKKEKRTKVELKYILTELKKICQPADRKRQELIQREQELAEKKAYAMALLAKKTAIIEQHEKKLNKESKKVGKILDKALGLDIEQELGTSMRSKSSLSSSASRRRQPIRKDEEIVEEESIGTDEESIKSEYSDTFESISEEPGSVASSKKKHDSSVRTSIGQESIPEDSIVEEEYHDTVSEVASEVVEEESSSNRPAMPPSLSSGNQRRQEQPSPPRSPSDSSSIISDTSSVTLEEREKNIALLKAELQSRKREIKKLLLQKQRKEAQLKLKATEAKLKHELQDVMNVISKTKEEVERIKAMENNIISQYGSLNVTSRSYQPLSSQDQEAEKPASHQQSTSSIQQSFSNNNAQTPPQLLKQEPALKLPLHAHEIEGENRSTRIPQDSAKNSVRSSIEDATSVREDVVEEDIIQEEGSFSESSKGNTNEDYAESVVSATDSLATARVESSHHSEFQHSESKSEQQISEDHDVIEDEEGSEQRMQEQLDSISEDISEAYSYSDQFESEDIKSASINERGSMVSAAASAEEEGEYGSVSEKSTVQQEYITHKLHDHIEETIQPSPASSTISLPPMPKGDEGEEEYKYDEADHPSEEPRELEQLNIVEQQASVTEDISENEYSESFEDIKTESSGITTDSGYDEPFEDEDNPEDDASDVEVDLDQVGLPSEMDKNDLPHQQQATYQAKQPEKEADVIETDTEHYESDFSAEQVVEEEGETPEEDKFSQAEHQLAEALEKPGPTKESDYKQYDIVSIEDGDEQRSVIDENDYYEEDFNESTEEQEQKADEDVHQWSVTEEETPVPEQEPYQPEREEVAHSPTSKVTDEVVADIEAAIVDRLLDDALALCDITVEKAKIREQRRHVIEEQERLERERKEAEELRNIQEEQEARKRAAEEEQKRQEQEEQDRRRERELQRKREEEEQRERQRRKQQEEEEQERQRLLREEEAARRMREEQQQAEEERRLALEEQERQRQQAEELRLKQQRDHEEGQKEQQREEIVDAITDELYRSILTSSMNDLAIIFARKSAQRVKALLESPRSATTTATTTEDEEEQEHEEYQHSDEEERHPREQFPSTMAQRDSIVTRPRFPQLSLPSNTSFDEYDFEPSPTQSVSPKFKPEVAVVHKPEPQLQLQQQKQQQQAPQSEQPSIEEQHEIEKPSLSELDEAYVHTDLPSINVYIDEVFDCAIGEGILDPTVRVPVSPRRQPLHPQLDIDLFIMIEKSRVEARENQQIHNKLIFDFINESITAFNTLTNALNNSNNPLSTSVAVVAAATAANLGGGALRLQRQWQQQKQKLSLVDFVKQRVEACVQMSHFGTGGPSSSSSSPSASSAMDSHKLAIMEMQNTRHIWNDFREQEAQIKLELANALFDDLLLDCVNELNRIETMRQMRRMGTTTTTTSKKQVVV